MKTSGVNFYGLKNCDTCRKASKALEAAGVDFTYTDVRADGVPEKTLKNWIRVLGPDQLVNRRSTTWRGLTDAEKAGADDAAKLVSLLQANPTLIKRPVLEAGGEIYLGWSEDVKQQFGL